MPAAMAKARPQRSFHRSNDESGCLPIRVSNNGVRTKFVLILLSAAALALGTMAYLRRQERIVPAPAPVQPAVAVSAAPAAAPYLPPPPPPPSVTPPAFAPAPVAAPAVTPQEKQANIEAEKDNLLSWQMSDDPQCLSNILADLNSPEKEIRLAAIQAAVQFENTNAIPVLRAQAANDNDPDEKAALLQAADYLSLPPLTFTTGNAPMTQQQSQDAAQRRGDSQLAVQARVQAQNGQGTSTPAPNNALN